MSYYFKTLKNTFNFSGRACRTEYWTFVLMNVVIAMALSFAAVFTSSPGALMNADTSTGVPTGEGLSPLFLVLPLFQLAMILPSVSVMVRRLHDTGRSGLWVLGMFVPFINLVFAIVLLVFSLQRSQHGPNNFGPNPQGVGNEAPRLEPVGQFGPQVPATPENYQNPFMKSA